MTATKTTFTEAVKKIAKTRNQLAAALRQKDVDGVIAYRNEMALAEQSMAELLANVPAGPADKDMALVFSEFTYEVGTIIPLDWVPTLERYVTEPITVIRVSGSVVDAVQGVLT